jgi:hypothetical protein
MRQIYALSIAVTLALAALVPVVRAQQDAGASIAVKDGGIMVAGWTGKIDDSRENAGLTIKDAKFAAEGSGFRVMTGPAVTYWNPANKASGTYTVKATFNEPKYENLNDHPHPYGIVIGGNDLDTPNMSLLYCAAYGDGRFIVRGFAPATFRMNGGMGESNAAIHKAAGKNQPVTQEIAVTVTADKVQCAINGTVVGSYDKTAVVGAGKLKSTDGVFGLRFGHNTEVVVTGFGVSNN